MKIFLTGATGFVGRAIANKLSKSRKIDLVVVLRKNYGELPKNVEIYNIPGLSSNTDFYNALVGVDVVIHSAAHAHVMHDIRVNETDYMREVNVLATLNLARQSVAAGVKRFIFISSIKVNGEFTFVGKPFMASDQPAPNDPYAVSKFEAEMGLHKIALDSGLEVVIVRPPLIYGPGVKANFASLLRWVSFGVPLPFGAINNNFRSLVSLENLVDFVNICVIHPAAAGQTFLVSDGEDVSTSELLRLVAKAMDKKIFLFPIPVDSLELFALLIRKKTLFLRLCNSLQVDIEKNLSLLGWSPPFTLEQGIKRTVEGLEW